MNRPIDAVISIFNATGIQGVFSALNGYPGGNILTGYFPCDKPPTVGFSFPSKSNLFGFTQSAIFNIPASAWAIADNGNNNCTAVLSGQNFPTSLASYTTLWIVGQGMYFSLFGRPKFKLKLYPANWIPVQSISSKVSI